MSARNTELSINVQYPWHSSFSSLPHLARCRAGILRRERLRCCPVRCRGGDRLPMPGEGRVYLWTMDHLLSTGRILGGTIDRAPFEGAGLPATWESLAPRASGIPGILAPLISCCVAATVVRGVIGWSVALVEAVPLSHRRTATADPGDYQDADTLTVDHEELVNHAETHELIEFHRRLESKP